MTQIDIELLPTGQVQIRRATADGIHREVRNPGDDLSDLPPDIQGEIGARWRPSVVSAWKAAQARMLPALTVADYSSAIQLHLDATAARLQYGSIFSAITYRGDPNPKFATEAEALFIWRSQVWTAATVILNGMDPEKMPHIEDVIKSLPAFVWPK